MDPTTAAWYAGFYERGGNIENDRSDNNGIFIRFTRDERDSLDEGAKLWGGTVKEVEFFTVKDKTTIVTRRWDQRFRLGCNTVVSHSWKSHEWRMSQTDSLKFIAEINPYMRIPSRIREIETAIEISTRPFDRTFKCKYCEKGFSSNSGRTRHHKEVHPDVVGVKPLSVEGQ